MADSRDLCQRCGEVLHTGEARVVVAFTVDELEALALATSDHAVAKRLRCALGLLDDVRARKVQTEWIW